MEVKLMMIIIALYIRLLLTTVRYHKFINLLTYLSTTVRSTM